MIDSLAWTCTSLRMSREPERSPPGDDVAVGDDPPGHDALPWPHAASITISRHDPFVGFVVKSTPAHRLDTCRWTSTAIAPRVPLYARTRFDPALAQHAITARSVSSPGAAPSTVSY